MLIAALAAIPSLAAEGRIPIPFTSPVVTPIVIAAPGRYVLTRPLKATAPGPVIDVAVGVGVGLSEVDIDLNGFTIDATPFAGAIGIRVTSVAGATAEVSISPQGTLTLVDNVGTQGRIPRNFGIDPTGSFLLALNQSSNNVVVFRIDKNTGRLSPTGQTVETPGPMCVRFLPVK
jgi:hypothetical protein